MLGKRILSYVSDIHIERKINLPQLLPSIVGTKNLLVLCGDITDFTDKNYEKNLEFFSKVNKTYRKTLYVPGNHEYDSNVYDPIKIAKYKPIIKDFIGQFPNIKLLDNEVYEEDKTVFLGTTLWSEAIIKSKAPNEASKQFEDYYRNYEYQRMEFFSYGKDQAFRQRNEFYRNCEWLRENIEKYREMEKIILTHYSPTSLLMEESYRKKGNEYISWYSVPENSSYIEDMINKNIRYWICGHIHNVKEIKINNLLCCVNAVGKNEVIRLKTLEY